MNNKKIKAVIFDMDGTIINTESLWKSIIFDYLKNKGITKYTPAFLDKMKNSSGGGLINASTIMKEEFSFKESIEELVKQKTKFSLEYMKKHDIHFINGFINFHKKLQEKLIPTSIGTNANIKTLNLLNKKLNFEQFFGKNMYSMEHVQNKAKPDPAVFLHAAQNLNIKPEECLVFEDSITGFKAAKNAGMTLVAIKNQFNQDILHNADYSIKDYTQAYNIIEKLIK
jgi:HAD superfamily hydrolase (TIGR01509 family)